MDDFIPLEYKGKEKHLCDPKAKPHKWSLRFSTGLPTLVMFIFLTKCGYLISHTFVELKEQSRKRLKEEGTREGVKVGQGARSVLLGIRVNLLLSWQQRPKSLRQLPVCAEYYAAVPY